VATDPKYGKVFQVRHTMTRAGQSVHFNSDLIFSDGGPLIVIEWEPGPTGDIPMLVVLIDPRHLRPPDGPDPDYHYELAIDDPRDFDTLRLK